MRGNLTATRAIDALAVLPEPFAHLFQTQQRRFRQTSVGLRAYVEQKVAVTPRRAYKVMHKLFRGLIVEVGNFVSPHAVHRLARLERQLAYRLPGQSGSVLARQVALENLYVLALERHKMVIVAHQTGRLQTVYMVVKAAQFPVETGILVLIPHTVEPYRPNLSIIGQKLRKLVFHKEIIVVIAYRRTGATCSETGTPARAIVAPPVDKRIIEMQLHALPVALVGQFAHHITPERSSIHYIVSALCRIPHRESLVMARSETDVLRT